MNDKTQKIISRINQLRAISKSTHSRAEAETCAALAAKLIAEYQLSEATIEAETGKTDDPLDLDGEHIIYQTKRTTLWKSNLAQAIAELNGLFIYVVQVRDSETHRKVSRYRIIGKTSSIQIALYMWGYLTETISNLADEIVMPTSKRGVNPDRESFCQGVVAGFRDKMLASKQEAMRNSTSAAMVLVSNAAKDAEKAFIEKTGIRLGRSTYRPQGRMVGDMYGAGYRQGGKISVNPGMTGGGSNPGKLNK